MKLLKRILAAALAVMTFCAVPTAGSAQSWPQDFPPAGREPSGWTGSWVYGNQEDTRPLEPAGQGSLLPLPWNVVECDSEGNPLPMLYAAGDTGIQGIIECSWMPYTNPTMPDRPNQPWLLVMIGGKIAYCVEPFNHNTNGGVQFVQKTDYAALSMDVQDTIAYIMRYGAKSNDQDAENIYLHMATQTLIWEVVEGNRAPYTLSGSPGGVYQDLAARYPGFITKYNQLISHVTVWGKIPSFASRLVLDAPTYKLEGSGPYMAELSNTAEGLSLSDFDFPGTQGISFRVSGSTLTASAASLPGSDVLITASRKGATSGGNRIFWFDARGVDQIRTSPGPDPVPCYFKLGTEASGPVDPEEPPAGNYQITISKLETGTDLPLSGAQFEIRFLGGPGDIIIPPANPEEPPVIEPEHQFTATATTNASGKITLSVPYKGVYKITELIPPANHKLAEQTVQTVTVNDGSPSARISYHNEPYTGITIQKIDAQTKAPLSGATFQLEQIDGNIVKTGITGPSGKLTFSDIPAASYRVTEIAPPPNYHLSRTPSQSVELKPDQMASLVFENEPYSGLRIRKVDAETGEGLSGALFSIHVKDGDLVGEALTDVNGLIIRENLPEGWYTVTEQQPPEGYLLDTPVRDVYVRPSGGGCGGGVPGFQAARTAHQERECQDWRASARSGIPGSPA